MDLAVTAFMRGDFGGIMTAPEMTSVGSDPTRFSRRSPDSGIAMPFVQQSRRERLEARAAPAAALSRARALLDQVAQPEFGIGVPGQQPHAQLARGVVDRPLVEAGLVQAVGVHARDHARVVGARVHAGAEGRRVCAVVELAEHDGPVDVGVDEADQDFGADARGVDGAPVRAGRGLGHAHPGAGLFAAWGVAVGVDC
jgi:hypothetical protein